MENLLVLSIICVLEFFNSLNVKKFFLGHFWWKLGCLLLLMIFQWQSLGFDWQWVIVNVVRGWENVWGGGRIDEEWGERGWDWKGVGLGCFSNRKRELHWGTFRGRLVFIIRHNNNDERKWRVVLLVWFVLFARLLWSCVVNKEDDARYLVGWVVVWPWSWSWFGFVVIEVSDGMKWVNNNNQSQSRWGGREVWVCVGGCGGGGDGRKDGALHEWCGGEYWLLVRGPTRHKKMILICEKVAMSGREEWGRERGLNSRCTWENGWGGFFD